MSAREECFLCGGEVVPQDHRGEVWPYKDDPSVEIVVECILPRCVRCGEGMLNDAQSALLGRALEASYRAKHAPGGQS